jgi:hypothetical protein
MARTITQIQAAIAAKRATSPELVALNSPSSVAIFRLLEYVMAVAIWTLETLFDRFRKEVDDVIASAPGGTAEWYADKALLFQEGDTLAVVNNVVAYPAGTTGAKVVTRASAKDNKRGKLLIKVAKDGPTSGTLAALSSAQLTQVRGYFDRIGYAGTQLEIVSRESDFLQLTGTVYYDPLLNVPDVQAAVRTAIRAYLANLDFAGQVVVSKLVDAIQGVVGVEDVELTTCAARVGAALPAVFTRIYETAAGYIVEETTAGLTFTDTLTFTANV